jgi:hypothetical protein
VLAPMGRPIDVHLAPGGRAFILEYTRPTNFKDQAGWLPGRVIELAAKKQAATAGDKGAAPTETTGR